MALFGQTPVPPTKLGRYRVLSPNAGVYVSPLQLGGASIGDKWARMGHMNKESSFKLLDAYYDAGGNMIDTACNYQEGTSEEFIGEWMEKRGIRDQLVIATKFTSPLRSDDSAIKVNFLGNSHKSLHVAVEQSLKRLRTTYIDILYVHWWTYDTSVEEIMNNLHSLVVARKVLYLGISDTPAWVVVKANQWAKFHGKTPFCVYQGRWNILERSFERDIIPMARSEGLALAPFGVLAEGHFRTDEEEQRRKETGEKGREVTVFKKGWERDENERKVSRKLEEIAAEVGAKSITAVAIAYVMHKAPFVFPIIGGRKVEHLQSNIEALDVKLTPEHIKSLESIVPFDLGFPHSIINDGSSTPSFFRNIAVIDKWQKIPTQPALTL